MLRSRVMPPHQGLKPRSECELWLPPPISNLDWADVEALLLKKVHEALERCRHVTDLNHYQGDLRKMLLGLFDNEDLPAFLPSALSYTLIKGSFKSSIRYGGKSREIFIFEKLNITMPVDGTIRIAEMENHDPRRWLTTKALQHGENLSDVLINNFPDSYREETQRSFDG